MAAFENTVGWKKVDDWIIERPDKVTGTDKGFILSGQRQSLYVDIHDLRCVMGAEWSSNLFDPSSPKDHHHYNSYVMYCHGSIKDNITIFSLNTNEERKTFKSLTHIRVTPVDIERRVRDLPSSEQIMSGILYFDETVNELGLEICIDREAFMNIFEMASRSPVPMKGSLHLLANIYYDEVDRFYEEHTDAKDFGFLMDDAGRCATPVGVQSMSLSQIPRTK